MKTIYKNEIKMSIKTLLLWTLSVAALSFLCIIMYADMKDDIAGMAEQFSSMGAFSNALGMDKLSIASLIGFYATEVGTIHALGGAMFAAIISCVVLSKEEDAHTGEFLFSLPVSKSKIVLAKLFSIFTQIILFQVLCVVIYILGFVIQGESIPAEFYVYHSMQLVMCLQFAAMGFAFSSATPKNKLGPGLGIVLLMYAFDMMGRIILDLKDFIWLSPFSYANAADLLSGENPPALALCFGIAVTVGCLVFAFRHYTKKDLLS